MIKFLTLFICFLSLIKALSNEENSSIIINNAIDQINQIPAILNSASNGANCSRLSSQNISVKNFLDETSLNTGEGGYFSAHEKEVYCLYKKLSASKKQNTIQWDLRELGSNQILAKSNNPHKLFYGASVSKIIVAAAYLDRNNGVLTDEARSHLEKLIKKSDNYSWGWFQDSDPKVLKGESQKGMEQVDKFVRNNLKISNSRMWRGNMKRSPDYWSSEQKEKCQGSSCYHGNDISAADMGEFLHATYINSYRGADELFKNLFYVHTGKKKGDKYLPKKLKIGGKTGTWKNNFHHAMVFSLNGKFYSLTILSTNSNEDVAIMAGGLIREYLEYPTVISCN